MPLSSTYVWFLQALNVINAALELHRDSLRLKPLLSQAETELAGCDLIVAIVDLDTGRLEDYVTIRLQQGGFVLVSHARTTDHVDWKVSRQYLGDVARNPRQYLDDPDLLDFDWLYQRLGVPVPSDGSNRSQLSIGASDA